MKAHGMKDALKFISTMAAKADKAASSSLNRVSAGVATELNRKTREEYTAKAGDIKGTIRVRMNGPNEAVVSSKGPNLALPKFKISPKARVPGKKSKPVKVSVKKGGGKKLKTGFISDLNSGHTGVFSRTPGVSRRRTKNRKGDYPQLPIEEGFGPAAPVMMNNDKVVEHVESEAKRRMEDRLDHEIGRLMR